MDLSSPLIFFLCLLAFSPRSGYENEAPCKRGIERFLSDKSLPRSAVFYTTKLRAPTSYEKTLDAIKYSLDNAPGGLIDLYLMHSAIGGPKLREDSWRAMEKGKKEGGLRSIGVSSATE